MANVCQLRSSLSFPEPAMIDAISARVGNAGLIRRMRGAHQSSGLSEISSQFHDEWSAAPARFFIDTDASSGEVRMNLALAPTTFTTGCSPIVLVTTPPQPASKARRMLFSDSVGGADERRKGFSNGIPVNLTARVDMWGTPCELSSVTSRPRAAGSLLYSLRHPVHTGFPVPLRGHLLRLRPELDRAAPGDVADAELGVVP